MGMEFWKNYGEFYDEIVSDRGYFSFALVSALHAYNCPRI